MRVRFQTASWLPKTSFATTWRCTTGAVYDSATAIHNDNLNPPCFKTDCSAAGILFYVSLSIAVVLVMKLSLLVDLTELT